jgi:stage V sporulation protein R
MIPTRTLDADLRREAVRIEARARAHGLRFFDLLFEMVDANAVNALCAMGGFPLRYPSWRFGMEYDRLEKGRHYGLSKIYELVINNDPVHAYLVSSNSRMEQKLVMAHVCGHADFFANNAWFAPTDRHMLGRMAEHAGLVRSMMEEHGQDAVERCLDQFLCLDTLLAPHAALAEHLRARSREEQRGGPVERARRSLDAAMGGVSGRISEERPRCSSWDVLAFLVDHAPLAAWQRELGRIVQAEARYFLPQRMTKISNEGWACFWHSRILTGGILEPSEVIDFADCHSGATAAAAGALNPYRLGLELWRYAEARGLDLFRLRRAHHDAGLMEAVVDENFARHSSLFAPAWTPEGLERGGWQALLARLVRELSWGGQPRIELVDSNHGGVGELALRHHHDGRDLDLAAAAEVLKSIAMLWGRRVWLHTEEEGQTRCLVSDGREVRLEGSASTAVA